MKVIFVLTSIFVWLTNSVFADEATVAELERSLLSGLITPEEAIVVYCESESTEMMRDAFCSCPEDALAILKQRLKEYELSAFKLDIISLSENIHHNQVTN